MNAKARSPARQRVLRKTAAQVCMLFCTAPQVNIDVMDFASAPQCCGRPGAWSAQSRSVHRRADAHLQLSQAENYRIRLPARLWSGSGSMLRCGVTGI